MTARRQPRHLVIPVDRELADPGMAAGDADARPQSAPAGGSKGGGGGGRGGRSGKGRKNKRGKRGGRSGKGGGGSGGGSGGGGGSGIAGDPQARQDGSPLPVAEARLAAADCFGAHTAAKERAVRAWCTAEFADEHVSDCGCFAWEIEKCRTVRTVPQWDADTDASGVACSIALPAALHRAGKPFAVLAEAALASAQGASEFAKAMEAESQQMLNELFVALYQNVQSHTLRVNEFCALIDLVGHKRRREIQLGPILRSINNRSCPAAVAKCSFEVISSQAYCQICHRVGVENGVSRCGDCGVVAYCSKRHAQMDGDRHQSWCKELQFSRVLQTALPWSSYIDTSRRLLMPHTPTSMLNRRLGEGSGKQAEPLALPAGWRQFFELHRGSRSNSKMDDSDADSERNDTSSGKHPDAGLDVFDEVLATDALSSVLTVAYALTKLGFASEPAPAGETKRLCLYLLGADHERELPWPELFSWFPHIEIAIVLIGPHTPTMAEREVDTKGTNVLVPPGRKMTVQGVAGCFHELSSGVILALPKPDAVFALNSGLIFYPTWADTVDRVLVRDVPPFQKAPVGGHELYNTA